MPRLLLSLVLAWSVSAAPGGLHLKVPMRDGAHLCTNVFVPPGSGKYAAILVRTPYGKGNDIGGYRTFLEHGYAVVVQDVRGRYHSEGVFRPLTQEGPDGSDTLDWIARQEWSNGSVGMVGGSYLGIVQWRVALLHNPHLKAIFPLVSGGDDYRDRFYSEGGALKLGHRLEWMAENLRDPGFPMPDFSKYVYHLPLRTADRAATGLTVEMYQQALDHPTHDGFWDALSTLDRIHDVRVPVFSVGGWFDNFAESDLAAFSRLGRLGPERHILVGPWPHNMSDPIKTIDLGPNASVTIRRYQLDWFDYWLKTSEKERALKPFPYPPVRIFVMGANVWRNEQEWPLARAIPTPFYLASARGANSLDGDGTLARKPKRRDGEDKYVYDPHRPVATAGGPVCCNPRIFPWGPMDQRPVEKRRDVLVYTTPPLKEDMEATGPIRVVLHVATSARDTDFTAKLVDVYPDGRAINLTDGILRLRYRESLEKPSLVQPGSVCAITIDAGVTSIVFKKKHAVRLEISSSNFPRFDRNLNTGRGQADETTMLSANQTIYHGRGHPSHLLLPVVPF